MPNYVKNAITFKTTEGLERFKKAYMPDGEFSFNSIDEMPASLDIERGGKTLLAFKLYVTKNHIEGVEYPLTLDLTPEKLEEVYSSFSEKEKKDYLRLGEQIVSNLREYGCADWYEWRISHWGTKWDAKEVQIDAKTHSIVFQTAWSAPMPIIEKIAREMKSQFAFSYADEDIGYNCGVFLFGGKYGSQGFGAEMSGTPEGKELAKRLWDAE